MQGNIICKSDVLPFSDVNLVLQYVQCAVAVYWGWVPATFSNKYQGVPGIDDKLLSMMARTHTPR